MGTVAGTLRVCWSMLAFVAGLLPWLGLDTGFTWVATVSLDELLTYGLHRTLCVSPRVADACDVMELVSVA